MLGRHRAIGHRKKTVGEMALFAFALLAAGIVLAQQSPAPSFVKQEFIRTSAPTVALLHVNVIDANTLREAQTHPEEYRNLLVRVTGYNAYFVGLGKEIQDEIIARESHQLG